MGPIGCPEIPVQNYHSMLCKIPEDRRSHLHHGGRQMNDCHQLSKDSTSELTSHERQKQLDVLYRICQPESMQLTQ